VKGVETAAKGNPSRHKLLITCGCRWSLRLVLDCYVPLDVTRHKISDRETCKAVNASYRWLASA